MDKSGFIMVVSCLIAEWGPFLMASKNQSFLAAWLSDIMGHIRHLDVWKLNSYKSSFWIVPVIENPVYWCWLYFKSLKFINFFVIDFSWSFFNYLTQLYNYNFNYSTIHTFLYYTIHIFKSELTSVCLHPAVPFTHSNQIWPKSLSWRYFFYHLDLNLGPLDSMYSTLDHWATLDPLFL